MEMFANLCTNISAARKDQIISILADHGIEYKFKAKMPFRMHPMDSAGIGGVGRTSGNFNVRYTVLVRKEEIEHARSLIRENNS